ncbi:hypothetical protein [Saccharospirillum salsuginis]|uniref:Outer membrane protein beta-barrel domain-containing protein n=1 Tax=Saccharospirillum salsuginis TaxID=418750 RepID=A0A918NCL7_9GAMM|nr:hypothetical protein [Saccharospirillum salsuginis]GGX57769.1 hypothetical protein GCM10007392_26760 [Saccharospirillum salsuginis]
MTTIRYPRLLIGSLMVAVSSPTLAYEVTLEAGPLAFGYNDAQIPNDDTGDRFDLMALTGAGPVPYVRASLETTFNQRHTVRALYAPVSIEGEGTLPEDTRFAGETFLADTDTTAYYQFNTYRLTYRYTFHDSPNWTLGVGLTALVRDADIRLTQGNTEANRSDLGVVPLLHFNAVRRFNDQWAAEFDIDAAGSPQGRAVDAALAAEYRFGEHWTGRVGYRTLEGGGDAGSVYTFAWLHYGLLGVSYTF